jgi:DNA-binding response OmpR family regulator
MNKKKVLIVEDDTWLAQQYQRILTKAGFRVILTSGANEAIDVVDEIGADIIVLDILLTGSTAFALLHELQSYSDTCNIPVIICTSLADELFIEDLKPYGVDSILDKTEMQPNDLTFAIRGALK